VSDWLAAVIQDAVVPGHGLNGVTFYSIMRSEGPDGVGVLVVVLVMWQGLDLGPLTPVLRLMWQTRAASFLFGIVTALAFLHHDWERHPEVVRVMMMMMMMSLTWC
jgi:hypothetical protein